MSRLKPRQAWLQGAAAGTRRRPGLPGGGGAPGRVLGSKLHAVKQPRRIGGKFIFACPCLQRFVPPSLSRVPSCVPSALSLSTAALAFSCQSRLCKCDVSRQHASVRRMDAAACIKSITGEARLTGSVLPSPTNLGQVDRQRVEGGICYCTCFLMSCMALHHYCDCCVSKLGCTLLPVSLAEPVINVIHRGRARQARAAD